MVFKLPNSSCLFRAAARGHNAGGGCREMREWDIHLHLGGNYRGCNYTQGGKKTAMMKRVMPAKNWREN